MQKAKSAAKEAEEQANEALATLQGATDSAERKVRETFKSSESQPDGLVARFDRLTEDTQAAVEKGLSPEELEQARSKAAELLKKSSHALSEMTAEERAKFDEKMREARRRWSEVWKKASESTSGQKVQEIFDQFDGRENAVPEPENKNPNN
ncbi:MAG: hypothetical protein ACR2OZ_00355 [Verrucomicrobiales bacterium]